MPRAGSVRVLRRPLPNTICTDLIAMCMMGGITDEDMASGRGWSVAVSRLMAGAGWFAGRRVDVDPWARSLWGGDQLEMHPAAEEFLQEFGGIGVSVSGRGRHFAQTSFCLDPMLCRGQGEWLRELSSGSRIMLYPIGEAGSGDASLAIAVDGGVWMAFNTTIMRVGAGRMALANLIEGVRPSGHA